MSEEIVIKSDIGGTVWKISAVQGQIVAQEETLLVVECMKLEVPVTPPWMVWCWKFWSPKVKQLRKINP